MNKEKLKRMWKFLVIVLLCVQGVFAFGQQVFADSTHSKVGIRFEGSVPQSDTGKPNNHSTNSTNQAITDQAEYPHTNELQTAIPSFVGGCLLLVCWILWYWKKAEKEKQQ